MEMYQLRGFVVGAIAFSFLCVVPITISAASHTIVLTDAQEVQLAQDVRVRNAQRVVKVDSSGTLLPDVTGDMVLASYIQYSLDENTSQFDALIKQILPNLKALELATLRKVLATFGPEEQRRILDMLGAVVK